MIDAVPGRAAGTATTRNTNTPTQVKTPTTPLIRPGLHQLGEGLHVGGHPGHDPAVELAVVVVEGQALEVGEDLDAQAVEHAFGRCDR